MERLKILLHHPALLPPKNYGGVERVVLWLAKGLIELGQDVSVVASPGSKPPTGAHLIPVEGDFSTPDALLEGELGAIAAQADILHFMAPPNQRVMESLKGRALLTVHGNGKEGERFPIQSTLFLSANHAKRHGSTHFVYNGLDPSEYRFAPEGKSTSFLFLSKTSWKVKNVRGAIRLCRKAGVPLTVAGGNRPMLPHLRMKLEKVFGGQSNWEGPVSGERKAELLSKAKALVFPILWDEPFGLVAIEALVSGTPVLGSPHGSLPELIPSSVGALPSSDEEWVRYLKMDELPFSPEACRQWVMEKFHYRKMTEKYLEQYQRMKSKKEL